MARVQHMVAWRLEHGSLCHVCPLNGQPKVGCDGPANANVVLVGAAPSCEDELTGRPFTDKVGYLLKARYLSKVGLAEVAQRRGSDWPKVVGLNAFIMNVIMCRPLDDKLKSKTAKKAVACCSRSAVALLEKLEAEKPRYVGPLSGGPRAEGVALALVTGEDKIAQYRGRVMTPKLRALTEMEALKIALRGVKPPEEWLPHKRAIAALLTFSRHQLRKPWPPPAEFAVHEAVIKLVVSRQRAALTRKAKKEAK